MSYPSNPSNPSNPFAPPGHQPPPQDPRAWAPVQQTGYAVPAPPFAPNQPYAPAPRGGNGLAITAVVLGALALLGVLALAVFLFVGQAVGSGGYALQGTVDPVGPTVTDSALEEAVTTAIEDDGGYVDEVECPAESKVGQGLVTVCHGSVDGFDWTGVVVFEGEDGSFIVTEY